MSSEAVKTKTCAYCHTRKPLTEYHRAQRTRDGLCRRCKTCCAAIRRLRYLKNREQVLNRQREYYAAHREDIVERMIAYGRKYYRRNKERVLEYGRKYREARKSEEPA